MAKHHNLTLGDRARIVPPHVGQNVLPNLPFFEKLVRFAHRNPPRIAIRDLNAGVEKSYLELLTDAIALRRALRSSLSPSTQNRLENDQEVFIAHLAPGGYEYAVGFVAILALGAAVVPISPALPPAEARSLITRAECVALLSSTSTTSLANSITTSLHAATQIPSPHIEILPHLHKPPLPPPTLLISSSPVPNMNIASLIIFTSGTTGPPKAAVQRRSYIVSAAEDVADQYRLSENDTVLHMLPVHHATGIGITFLPFLVSGACVEFRSGGFDAAWTWERFRRNADNRTGFGNGTGPGNGKGKANGEITVFSGVPTMYIRLMRFFESHILPLPEAEREEYISSARAIRVFLCGTSALPGPVQDFWKGILGGRSILTRFGGTEFHAVIKAGMDGAAPVNSVGVVSPGVDVKLDGEGMVLVRGPNLFSKYLNDEVATKAAHDAEGYFITGDIARREGEDYHILGRASIDIIKSGGYKISALDIEREILGLEYVSEVMVVGVEDEEYGQRVAAAVTLKDEYRAKGGKLSIDQLRGDLRGVLAGYKMPTLLRVLEEEIPKSATGKVQKRILGPKFFPRDYGGLKEVQVWEKGKGGVEAKL
ncbi:hypothetical protein BJY04DRAFT_222986 [Aspergillus karnatakaensis]|uniref:uncharacterized protein n=1 Tax=Aspergillus karnatakaensis TaxID=1810916 RepID=UPI003CCE04CD